MTNEVTKNVSQKVEAEEPTLVSVYKVGKSLEDAVKSSLIFKEKNDALDYIQKQKAGYDSALAGYIRAKEMYQSFMGERAVKDMLVKFDTNIEEFKTYIKDNIEPLCVFITPVMGYVHIVKD